MKPMTARSLYILSLLFCVLFTRPLGAAPAPDLDDQTRVISSELRCVVCQNLSVADSPSEMAQQMRVIVRDQLQAGKSPEQIKDFFVSKYGEWVLLKPKITGISALLWILPYVVLVLGVLSALWFVRRWVKKKKPAEEVSPRAPGLQQMQSEFLRTDLEQPDLQDTSVKAQLLRGRARLRSELAELDFDFQSGKLSESDFAALRQEIETKGASVVSRLAALPSETKAKPASGVKKPETCGAASPQFRSWQLIAGGVFLLVFGLALGVMLTRSVRERDSEGGSITGDFMTGTTPPAARAALAEGKQAFSKQDFPKAIEAFKKVFTDDPNNPEAHTYMGYILVQTGHGDGALIAFDRALSRAPNFPMALWGKGMVLYQDKKDYAGARQVLEQLLSLIPPGPERNEVVKVLAEIPTTGGAPTRAAAAETNAGATSSSSTQISGKITIDPKLKASIDPNAALFIIARRASGAGGPPLAVKKVDRPTFPLDYTLSQDNVMMQGMPFTGKITVTVRLDKDGNPVTRTPGDMTGDYKKNPVAVSSQNIDILLDQIVQ
jgi:cytochrome c-type biogenesis protein CcmH